MTSLSIYLCGKIQKSHEPSTESYWSKKDLSLLCDLLDPLTLYFLNPADRKDDLSDQKGVFGRDMLQVYSSDVVFVDARDRRGLGVGAEMMWAKIHTIPVVTLAPHNTHYRKNSACLLNSVVNNWLHPFIEGLSDAIVADLQEGADWIKKWVEKKIDFIKGPQSLEEAMHYYIDTQLANDLPMQSILKVDTTLAEKIQNLQNHLLF